LSFLTDLQFIDGLKDFAQRVYAGGVIQAWRSVDGADAGRMLKTAIRPTTFRLAR